MKGKQATFKLGNKRKSIEAIEKALDSQYNDLEYFIENNSIQTTRH